MSPANPRGGRGGRGASGGRGVPRGRGAKGSAGGPAGRSGKRGASAKPSKRASGAPAGTGAPRGRPGAARSRGGGGAPPPGGRRRRPGVGGEQVEGRQAVRELLLAGSRRVHEVFLAADLDAAEVLDDIRELAQELRVPVREVSRGRLDGVAHTEAPQGVVARAAPLPEAPLEELVERGHGGRAPFLLVLDGVTDPGNLGALLRSAECAGVTGIVLPRHRAVHVTPTVTKAAAGAVEHLPFALVGGVPAALTQLHGAGLQVVGLDAGGDRPLWNLQVGSAPVCVVLGAEGRGLSRLTRQRCDEVAAIPLEGRLASLNVSVAGALACFEIARGRLGPDACM